MLILAFFLLLLSPCYQPKDNYQQQSGCERSCHCYTKVTCDSLKQCPMGDLISSCVGAAIGAVLACGFAIYFRSYEEWRTFQQEIAAVQDRFASIEFGDRPDMRPIFDAYRESMDDVKMAVFRVRPYLLWPIHRVRLGELFEKYRQAHKSPDSGMVEGTPNPWRVIR